MDEAQALVDAEVTSGAYALVMEAIVLIAGVGGAWLAWLIDLAIRRIAVPVVRAT